MKRKPQLYFNDSFIPKKEFGGSLLKNSNAKKRRPLSTKVPVHLVLRSSIAKGAYSLRGPKTQYIIKNILSKQARKFGISIMEYSNNGNHLHLLVKLSNLATYKSFIRSITGLIARAATGAEKNSSKNLKFWDKRPYTRLVQSFRGYKIAKDYVIQNHLEYIGVIPYTPRKTRYSSA